MTNESSHDLLRFETPTMTPTGWETAEAQAFRFPQRYIAKCQEFGDYARGLAALEQEKNHLFDFVVRNLLSAMDTVEFVAEELGLERATAGATGPADVDTDGNVQPAETESAAADEEGDEATPDQTAVVAESATDEATPEANESEDGTSAAEAGADIEDAVAISRRGVESVRRSLLNVLEGLHIVPVDLRGQTYRSVEVNGRVIEDPYEIVEARNQGKATELPVLEVITSLWVQTEPGLRVIRKGQVVC